MRVKMSPQAPAIYATPGAIGTGKCFGCCSSACGSSCCFAQTPTFSFSCCLLGQGSRAAHGLGATATAHSGHIASMEAPGLCTTCRTAIGRHRQSPGTVSWTSTVGRLGKTCCTSRMCPLAIVAVMVATGRGTMACVSC